MRLQIVYHPRHWNVQRDLHLLDQGCLLYNFHQHRSKPRDLSTKSELPHVPIRDSAQGVSLNLLDQMQPIFQSTLPGMCLVEAHHEQGQESAYKKALLALHYILSLSMACKFWCAE